MKKTLNLILTVVAVVAIVLVGFFAIRQVEKKQSVAEQTKLVNAQEKAIKQAYKKAAAQGEQYIQQAKYLDPYESSVVVISSNGYPASALAYAPANSNHYDNILQVYVQSEALTGDVNKAIDFWNQAAGKTIAKLVATPGNADVVIAYADDENTLQLPEGKGGITYYNEKGSQGKNSYIIISNHLDQTLAKQDVIVVHEMGHALGLAHREPDDSTQANTDKNFDLMNTVVGADTPYSLSKYDKYALLAAEQYWPLAYKNYLK